MDMSWHDWVVERLLEARGSWPHIARTSGVSRRTIEKIAHRKIKDPGVSHIEKLVKFFSEAPVPPEPQAETESGNT